MHPQPQLTCTAHRRVQAPGCPSFSSWVQRPKVDRGTAGRNFRLGGEAPCSAAAPAPRPQQRLLRRQAGVTLGSERGCHSLVGFLLESPEGREKGNEKGPSGIHGMPPPPQRHSDPKHQRHGAVARVVMSRTPLCHDTQDPMSDTGLLAQHRAKNPGPSSTPASRPQKCFLIVENPQIKCKLPEKGKTLGWMSYQRKEAG